ncbi:hypothetical protein LJR090_004298 [Bosea sp. LjRoot90]|uniref:hypothetical protein n=1 Tax=Bosea sp. LjRoot90 TaxID=3342342 RepID=UPI003ECE69A3
MTTPVIDNLAVGELTPAPIEPRFGEIGIAAVAGALTASRPNGAGRGSTTQPLLRSPKGAGADAAAESLSYELSST